MLWEALGIKVSILLSGIAGGVVSLTYEDKIPPIRAIGMIFCGGATAAYTQPVLTHYLSLDDVYANAIGFFLGLVSMKIVGILLSFLEHFKKNPTLLIKLIPYVDWDRRSAKLGDGDNDPTRQHSKTDTEPS